MFWQEKQRAWKASKLKKPKAWLRPDVMMASILINLLGLAMPMVVLQVYDRILPNQSVSTLGILMIALVCVAVLEGFIRVARSVLLNWCGARYEYKNALNALNHLLHCDLVAFESQAKGVYLEKFQALEQIREFYHGQSILVIIDAPFVFLFLGLIWTFAGYMVLIPISVMLLFMLVSLFLGHSLRKTLKDKDLQTEHRQNFLIESLQGIHTLKSMAMENQILRRYERLQGQSAAAIYDLARVNSIIQGLGATFSQAVMVSFVSIGSIFAVKGQLSIGALAAGTMLAGRVLQPTLKAMGFWTHMQSVRMAEDKFSQLLSMPSEAVHEQTEEIKLKGGIELKNVCFKHSGSDQDLLKDISLKIEPGEIIGISGPNGSGKSTLLNLIMGFVKPNQGKILLDDRDLFTLDRSSVRMQIGLVPQEGVLFQGTLLENMTLFREGDSIDKAIDLAKQLGLDETINHMPDGLDTEVSSSLADSIPLGFRQRLIMVRALLGDQKIILFDDANAGLDHHNDVRLMTLLKRLKEKHTMVIISHRPSLLKVCDRRYSLNAGQLHDMDNGNEVNITKQVNPVFVQEAS